METAKGSQAFKFDHYSVSITIFNESKLEITVIDPIEKVEFHEGLLMLQKIGTTTLIKALQRQTSEVKMGIQINKTSQNTVLQIDILVASQFLRPVEETIFIKKCRDISESEILKSSIENISSKIKKIKEDKPISSNVVRVLKVGQADKYFNSANYETIASITLPKGKHLLTVSFLAKIQNSWMYLYFKQNQHLPVVQNNGFYVQTNASFFPFLMIRQCEVTQHEETVQFTTYCSNSYPFTLRNFVLSAQKVI